MLTEDYLKSWTPNAPNRLSEYATGTTSWVVGLPPERALEMEAVDVSRLLYQRLGEAAYSACLDPAAAYPSPVANEPNGNWLKTTHTVGVNVRTIGDFWKVLHYAITLPDHIRGVHLLPIWEPGVVGSLYGMASWEINPEFYSKDMLRMFPHLSAIEDQLAVVVNFLHALGKVVGMDVIPHTDRYSEIVLANPDLFEWLLRDDLEILDHREYLHEEVQGAIYDWLQARGPAQPAYGMVGELWQLPEADRLKIFFGEPKDYGGRQARRVDLIDWLYRRGFEPAPATMAPPYRGLEVDPRPEAMTTDAAGRVWRDYRLTEPTEMSRAFGPLTRYKLYARKDDNQDWAIDFEQPRPFVWQYLTQHYAAQQARYHFDFMRGDMSHVQMRPDGVPASLLTPATPTLPRAERAASSPLSAEPKAKLDGEGSGVRLRAERAASSPPPTPPSFRVADTPSVTPDAAQRSPGAAPPAPPTTSPLSPGEEPGERDFYDPLQAVKQSIQLHAPHFAYFAESFLTAPGYMAYGDEVEHLTASQAEVTLGNLQSTVPGTEDFWAMTNHYLDVATTTPVTPAWTAITGDKDDPRFDLFHHFGELARMFTGLFLGTLPLYFSLGYEQRDRHLDRWPNEYYSKLYVFQETRGDKMVSGPFRWGNNLNLFAKLTDLHQFAAGIMAHLGAPEVLSVGSADEPVLAWLRPASDGDGAYLFVASFAATALELVRVSIPQPWTAADLLFTTDESSHILSPVVDGEVVLVGFSGGRCYRVQ